MTEFNLRPGDRAINVGHISKPGPYYIRLGIPGKRWNRDFNITVNGMNTIPIFKNLSKPASLLWWTLTEIHNDETNISVLRSKSLSNTERKNLKKATTELIQVDLIKKIKKEHYLLNPLAIVPLETYTEDTASVSNFLNVKKHWDSLI